tara:strand:- start:1529 stop:1630 length:102 start_codon:yes stop_codon:yes gene_type:complete
VIGDLRKVRREVKLAAREVVAKETSKIREETIS